MKVVERCYAIDLMRVFAAISVVCFHYFSWGAIEGKITTNPFPELGNVSKYGYLGVDLFFIISGYVILLSSWNKSLSNFITSRIARLYPAFLACLTITSLITILIGAPNFNVTIMQYIVNLTMVPRVFGAFGIQEVDGVYWSLLVEITFYFWMSIILLLKQQKNLDKFLFFWLIVSIILEFLVPIKILQKIFISDWSSYFIIGAIFFLIHQREKINIILKFTLILAMTVAIILAIRHVDDRQAHGLFGLNYTIVTAILLVFFTLFSFIVTEKAALLNHKIFQYFGNLTYPVYLVHACLGYMLFNYFTAMNRWLLLGVVLAIVIGLASFVHFYIERLYTSKFRNLLRSMLT